MKQNLTSMLTARFWTWLASIMLLTLVAACGGGNGSAGAPISGSGSGTSSNSSSGASSGSSGTTAKTGSISIALSNAGTPTNTIPSTGSLTVSATVLTASGAAAPANTLVAFSITSGQTSATLPVLTALTNGAGVATVNLLPGSQTGAGTLTATATLAGSSTAITGSANFEFTATQNSSTNGSIAISLTNPATGLQTITIPTGGNLTASATVLTPTGTPVPDGTLVTFAVNGSAGALSVTTALTTSGVASVSLAQGTSGGAATLTATATIGNVAVTGSVNFQTIVPPPSANPNGVLTVTLQNGTTPANTIPSGGNLNVIANVVTGSGAPAPIFTVVTFAVSNSTGVLPVTTALTNAAGNATVLLQPGSTLGAGTVTASATAVGTTVITGSVNFQSNSTGVTPTNGGQLALTLTNSAGVQTNTIPAAGTLEVTATLTNASGTAIPNTVVGFSVSNGTGALLVSTALTNSSGVAVVGLQNGTQAGAGTVTASATVAGVSVTQSISYQTSSSAGSSATPSISLILVPSSTCPAAIVNPSCPLTANATVHDAAGDPVSNVLVNFGDTLALTGLAPSSGTVLTNSAGVATVVISTVGLPTSAQNGSAGTINVSTTVSGVTVANAANFTVGTVPTTLKLIAPTPNSGSTTAGAVTVPAYGTTTLSVEVDVAGVAYTGQPITVNFASNCQISGKATLPATATTAVNGQASVTYTDHGCANTDTVTASVAGSTGQVTISVTDTAPQAQNIIFVGSTPTDQSIILGGTSGSGRTNTAILTFEVVDQTGAPLGGQNVSFAINNPSASSTPVALITSPSGPGYTGTTSTTNSTTTGGVQIGQVQVAATSNSVGTFSVVATLVGSSPAINATSNNIVVSTGQPVQASFTIAPVIFNLEGFNLAGNTTAVTAFIADANGNPVVNDTPVSATTNEGSIGNSSGLSGGCTTVNGQCSVTFTTQNPRSTTCGPAPGTPCDIGIATLNFTSSNQTTNSITGQTQIYMSAAYPYFFFDQYAPSATNGGFGGSSGYAYVSGTTPPILMTQNCSPYITLYLSDENGNPLPQGTTLTVTSATTGFTIGNTSPAVVANTAVGSGTQISSVTGGFTPINGVINAQALTIAYTTSSALGTCKALNGSGTGGSLLTGHGQIVNFQVTTQTTKGQVQVTTNFAFEYPT